MSNLNCGKLNATDRIKLPVYNNSTRPGGQLGDLIFNIDEGTVEFHNGTEWQAAAKTNFEVFGGAVSTSGQYTVHTFTGVDTMQITGSGQIEYLIVAGGGGGGMDMGGGGGGGGVITGSKVMQEGTYPVQVGSGGPGAPAGATNGQPGSHQFTIGATTGEDTQFDGLIAKGGGTGGSSYHNYTPESAGGNGGSGGGASGYSAGSFKPGGQGTALQGKNGGRGGPQYYSGGGGGSAGQGANSTAVPNGGDGVTSSIMGISYAWGGGGGGAGYSGPKGGNGGNGGGGGGVKGSTPGGAGLNPGSAGGTGQQQNPGGNGGSNTGGGGGGGSHYSRNNKGGNGGSGIVVVRYIAQ